MTPLRDRRTPAAVDAALYETLPENCRAEALARTAWLIIRGSPPLDAFEAALKGMHDDEMEQESLASWDAVHAACATLPRGGRLGDATPTAAAFGLALAMDGEVASALEVDEDPAERAARLAPLCSGPKALDAVLAWVARRIVELAPAHAAQAAADEDAQDGWAGHDGSGDGDGHGDSAADGDAVPSGPYRPWLWQDPDPWALTDD